MLFEQPSKPSAQSCRYHSRREYSVLFERVIIWPVPTKQATYAVVIIVAITLPFIAFVVTIAITDVLEGSLAIVGGEGHVEMIPLPRTAYCTWCQPICYLFTVYALLILGGATLDASLSSFFARLGTKNIDYKLFCSHEVINSVQCPHVQIILLICV